MQHLRLGIVERNAALAARLGPTLAEVGILAEAHADPRLLLALLTVQPPRLVVLGDVAEEGPLPTLQRVRAVSRIPCVVVAAADPAALIVLLDAGADAVLDPALPERAMLACCTALLRRAQWGLAEPTPPVAAPPSAGWRLVQRQRRLLRPDGSECELTTAEFDLMRLLVESRGLPVSRDDISRVVFKRYFRAEDRTVDNLVLRLRKKLGPGQEKAIGTVRNAGYTFAGFTGTELRVA